MQAYTQKTGRLMPLDRPNVDTDQIIPKQFLKSIKRTGFGVNLFDEWRYLDEGYLGQDHASRPKNMAFVLNDPKYKDASILLARENFGCGSSREHAPWALLEYGFNTIIAPSFADIFYNNCLKNAMLPIVLSKDEIDALFEASKDEVLTITVDLPAQQVCTKDATYVFDIDAFAKHCLVNGLDDIALTLLHKDKIATHEAQLRAKQPWLFALENAR